jgi:hypothetical protein
MNAKERYDAKKPPMSLRVTRRVKRLIEKEAERYRVKPAKLLSIMARHWFYINGQSRDQIVQDFKEK